MGVIQPIVLGVLLAGVMAMPSVAFAQEEPTMPEGVEWRLTGYLDPEAAANPPEEGSSDETEDGASIELSAVPLGVSATLRLEGGQAAGSGGCNTFGGSYALDGSAITFTDVVTTLVLCEESVQAVEDAYLGALAEVRSWLISEGVLELADEAGATLLTFEVPDISLTSSELAGLVSSLEALGLEITGLREDVDALGEDVSDIDADELRQRIRSLETTTRRLGRELDARAEEPADPTGGINAAERVLLEGIPQRIASQCEPLRSGRPAGTRAAVTCKPATEVVSSVDYFLMDGPDAAAAFADEMTEHDVTEPTSEDATCAAGRRAQHVFLSSLWKAEGCYRAGGEAYVRFVDVATDCRQLPVPGGRRLREPAIYMALNGTSADIARVYGWASDADDDSPLLTRISREIERPGQPRSPGCVT